VPGLAEKNVRLRSILCAVDFSDASREALSLALAFTQRSGGRVTALFVNDPTFLLAAGVALHRRPRVLGRSAAELRRFVNQTASRRGSRPAQSVACRVSKGSAAAEILRTARELKIDLVVMGTHGLGGLNRLFFGSTTRRVLRRSAIPVLAVPPLKIDGTIRRIVLPLDLAGDSERELDDGCRLARLFDTELVLAHVVPRIHPPPWLRADLRADDRRRLASARAAVQRAKGKAAADVRTIISVALGVPDEEIARLAAEASPSLVVMASRGALRARPGSTTEKVIARATAPVLAIPRR
jgi:nucleotide-binding universal stress UspA family protein